MTRTCRACGRTFDSRGGNNNPPRECSAACKRTYQAAYKRQRRPQLARPCAVCGTPFTTSRLTGPNAPKTCASPTCRRLYYNARQLARSVAMRAGRSGPFCRHCGRPFKRTGPCQKFCAVGCRKANWNAVERARRTERILNDPEGHHRKWEKYYADANARHRHRMATDPEYRAAYRERSRASRRRREDLARERRRLLGFAQLAALAASAGGDE